jgi:hypothetical protein
VVVLANGPADVTDLAFEIAEPLVDAIRARPRGAAPQGGTPMPGEMGDYLGVYAWPRFDETLRIGWRDGALTLAWVGRTEPRPTLEPSGETDVFWIRGGRESGERCRFTRDDDGVVIRADLAGYPLERLRGTRG